MVRATWRVLAFGALMAAMALPASAQVVIGGSGQPNVEVNWSVLDRLGRQPTLADMLKGDVPVSQARAALNQPASKTIQYRPYKAAPDKPQPSKAKQAKKIVAAKPTRPVATPIAAKAEVPVVSPAVAQLVQAAQKAEPVKAAPEKIEAAKADLPKVAQPALPPKPAIPPVAEPVKLATTAGPQVTLPEVSRPIAPAPVAAPAPAPAAAPAPVAASSPVSIPSPVATAQPAALTPTPLAPTPPVVKPEPVQQEAALPPAAPAAPAPSPSVSGKGDSLTVAFGADSARLPDAVHSELDKLVKRMQKDDGLALQLLAYAEGDEASASKARRLSLSRALEVRKYLMEQGVRSTRIEVRALGNKQEGAGPADRVDAVVVSR